MFGATNQTYISKRKLEKYAKEKKR